MIGLIGVLPVSVAEIISGQACPHLGAVPACHIVSIAYANILVLVLHPRAWKTFVFLLAWIPIFLLAALGSSLEIIGDGTCPKTEAGIPKCFFSLGLAIALFAPFIHNIINRRRLTQAKRIG